MRRLAATILGLLLVLGPGMAGSGHVHAAADQETAGDLHVDHLHLGPDGGAHHHPSDHGPELAADHDGDDAVALSWARSERTPKRALPCLTASVEGIEPPEAPSAEARGRPGTRPRDPPLNARPGRGPPA